MWDLHDPAPIKQPDVRATGRVCLFLPELLELSQNTELVNVHLSTPSWKVEAPEL